MTIISPDFFARPTLTVAREALGLRLVREIDGQRVSGIIVEAEAYIGTEDTACHASKGRTPRTEVMFGPPGHAYVYIIYGIYHMLNVVTEPKGFPAAVLIRAMEPEEGLAVMRRNRQGADKLSAGKAAMKATNLTSGPGKLCRALAIDKSLNEWPLSLGQQMWLETAPPVADALVSTGPRIGLTSAAPKDVAAPWRFWLTHNRFVSRK